MTGNRKAVVLGATGLVGGCCLQLLLDDATYNEVRAMVRRPVTLSHPKLRVIEADYDRISLLGSALKADDVFCCLGTTMKKAGTREAFRKVDYEYPVNAAKAAAAQGSRQFLLVSALGANRSSRVFYNRVKGEAEDAIRMLPFEAMHIFRPSLLLGRRTESRPGEKAGMVLMTSLAFLFVGKWMKYRAIAAETVAIAMVNAARQGGQGVHIYESNTIEERAKHA
jgi:uncharacterized protein YbjT (DUF2867 family)